MKSGDDLGKIWLILSRYKSMPNEKIEENHDTARPEFSICKCLAHLANSQELEAFDLVVLWMQQHRFRQIQIVDVLDRRLQQARLLSVPLRLDMEV